MEKQPTNGILEDFRIELLDCWRRLPNKGLFFLLLVAWLALFQFLGNSTLGYIPTPSLLQWMYIAYASNTDASGSDDSHAKIVPFIVLALFWWKRKQLLAHRSEEHTSELQSLPTRRSSDLHCLCVQHGRERFRRLAREDRSLYRAGPLLVETQAVARPQVGSLVAGAAVGGVGTRPTRGGVHGATTKGFHRSALRWHLRSDGFSLGTRMAARQLLPVLPLRLLCALGVVRRII